LQVRELMKGSAPDQPSVAPVEGTAFAPAQPTAVQPTSPGARRPEAAAAPEVAFASSPPSLSSRIQQAYLPVRRAASAAALDAESREGGAIELQSRHLLYVPAVVGMGRVHFVDERKGVQEQEDFALLAQAPESIGILAWEQAQPLEMTLRDLSDRPEPEAYFDELPQAINESKEFTALKDDLDDYLYRNTAVTLLYSPVLEAYSKPRESERDYRMRLQQAAREKRDEEIDEINERYEKKLDTLEDRLRRYEAKLAEREADVAARKRETVVSVGESMVGLFLGRRSTRMASTALSKQRQAAKAKLRVEEAEDDVKALQEDIEELEEELQEEVAAIQERWEEALETFEEAKVTPRRADIQIDLVALAWVPHWQLTYEARGGTVRTDLVEAY
jgi:TolA-binding protein